VQRRLAGQVKGTRGKRAPVASPLAGKLVDEHGEPLLASHTSKGEQRYRYYVSKALHHASSSEGMRLPAREIEQVVASALADLLADPLKLADLAELDLKPAQLQSVMARAEKYAARLRSAGRDASRLITRIEVREDGLNMVLCCLALSEVLGAARRDHGAASLTHFYPVRLTRTGRTIRLVQPNGALALASDGVDPALLRLIAKAQDWWQALSQGQLDPTALAEREGVTDSWVIRVVRLAYLSPRVVEGIIAGRLRAGIDGTALLKAETISLDWEEQEKQLLIA
jgi:site-specific DNA recombinase